MAPSTTAGGAIPWMSPELLYPEKFGLKKSHLTKGSDCYALGMVIYEVLGGQAPFASRRDPEILYMVLGGERPERPRGDEGKPFTDRIWEVLEHCWQPQPSNRLSAKAVLMGLEGKSPFGPPYDTDGDTDTDPDDRSDDAASGSGTLSPFHPRLILNRPCTTIEPSTRRGGDGLPDPPRTVSPKRGWFSNGMVHNIRKTFDATRKFFRN